ncbi:MAG: hypothetical protein ACXWPI_12430 [Ktedonobacterales bacterium]
MPFLDRYWWLRIPIALLPLGAVLFIIAYVLSNPSEAMRDPLLGSGCAGVGALVLLVFAFFLMVRIGPARNRLGRRHAAIASNQDAIPPAYGAEILAETALPSIPFTVTFPLTRWDQSAFARLRVILNLPLFAIALVLTFLLESQGNRTLPLVIGSVVLYVLGAITHLWPTIITRPYIRTYHTPRHILADTMGIRWQPIVGPERAIRWDEMRLLEVASFNATPFTSNQTIERRRYTLYTQNSAVWWVDPGNLHLPPSGPYAQLLALIKVRTGLEPRTFDSEDLFATAPLRVAVEPPAAAPLLVDDAAYLLAFPLPTWRGRIIAGLFGIVLTTLAVLAGVWTLSLFGVFVLPPFLHIATSWLHATPAFFLLIGGIIGLPLLIGALRATPTRSLRRKGGIRADDIGISHYPSRKGTPIAWSEITDIQCETLGRTRMFIVRSAVDDIKIMWSEIPVNRVVSARLITALGFTPISSDELVSLVMHMTGKPLTSRDPQPSIPGATHAAS